MIDNLLKSSVASSPFSRSFSLAVISLTNIAKQCQSSRIPVTKPPYGDAKQCLRTLSCGRNRQPAVVDNSFRSRMCLNSNCSSNNYNSKGNNKSKMSKLSSMTSFPLLHEDSGRHDVLAVECLPGGHRSPHKGPPAGDRNARADLDWDH